MCVCSLYGKYQVDRMHIPFSMQVESKKKSQYVMQGNTQ